MYKIFLKRVFDILFSLVFLPVLFFLIIIIGPIIYLQDKGTIFYIAERLGKDGNLFKMYKFRSMKLNAPDLRNKDGSTFNAANDFRLTKVGKFIRKTSLDETPQILNVLKGNMSIIGPRPDLPGAIKKYDSIQIKKLKVRPGITGYSQAYFRNSIDMKEKYLNDVYYVNNLSFKLDLKIFVQTLRSIVSKKNIFNENNKKTN